MLGGVLAPLAASLSSFLIQDPRQMSFEYWARTTLLNLDAPVEVWLPWQDWAATQISKGVFNPKVPPDPYQYSDWMEWALRLRDSE